MRTALVLLADGSEEMEAVIVVDVLRRAGWNVSVAAVGDRREVVASRGVQLTADVLLSDVDVDLFDVLVLPGGKGGAERFVEDTRVQQVIWDFAESGKALGAICAAPLALAAAGVLAGKRYTCYPGVEASIREGIFVAERVVQDGILTTSRGPGTAFAFALQLVAAHDCLEKAARLEQELILP